MIKNIYKTIDLFAGIGGIRLGFELTGRFETVFANDFDKNCKYTYDLNTKDALLTVDDITTINPENIPEYDFLLAGFPCQAFSIAGYRQGFNDEKGRGNLFFDIVRFLDYGQPMGFLLENVKNLQGHDKGRTFKVISQELMNLGYHFKYKVLNTMEYGNLPQNRERIYIVGFKDKSHYEKFKFPKKVTLTKTIEDILEFDVDSIYHYNDKPLYNKIKNEIIREDTVYQWRRVYVRENKNNVFPTLTANMGTGGHNVPIVKQKEIIRKITPRECARIQGFPESFRIPNLAKSHLYKQFGNSVSVTVVQRIADQIIKAIES